MEYKIGDVFSWEKTFTKEEILAFAELTGDKGNHHMIPDDSGRLMVHGLLTASIGTKIGGDINFIARELVSEFIRPVFSGDTVTCELKVENIEEHIGFKKVTVSSIYRNQHGKEVLLGSSYGIVKI